MEINIIFSTNKFGNVKMVIGNLSNICIENKKEKEQFAYIEPKTTIDEIFEKQFVKDQQEYIIPVTTG